MSLIMELDPETEARLNEKARENGAEPGRLAALIVSDALRAEPDDYDEPITPEEMAQIVAAVRRGDEDFASGR